MNEYYKNLPKKRMAAGALIFDGEGRVLIVKPSYKDHWSIPGGVVDERESPRDACAREIREEIGITIPVGRLLCVDYTKERGEKDESLQFIFYGGVLGESGLRNIRIDGKEIIDHRFVPCEEAIGLFGGVERGFAKRVAACFASLNAEGAAYLEDGE